MTLPEILFAADRAVFVFINQTLANPFFDFVMPAVTDWNKSWIGLSLFAGGWLLLMWKGGRKGRILGLLLIPLIVMSDQLSSSLLKMLVHRPRPCHLVNGILPVGSVRLLVPCGGGYSFPSSHAVNNFAFAAFLAFYYRRWQWLLFTYAAVMALSRVIVGVHYPSDILAGSLIGFLCAYVVIGLWESLARQFPVLALPRPSARHAQP